MIWIFRFFFVTSLVAILPLFAALAQVNSNENNALVFQINNTEKARISDTGGNFGIGTSDPVARLTVAGNVSVSGMIDVGHTAQACSTAISGSIRYETVSDSIQVCTGSGWKSLVSNTTGLAGANAASNTGAVQFNSGNNFAGDTATLFWDNANKRLGIGTPAPGAQVHISATGDAVVILEADTDNVTEADNPYIQLVQDGGAVLARIGYDPSSTSGNDLEFNNTYSQGLALKTADTTRLYINASGLIGIGTASPTQELDVYGDINLSGPTSRTISYGTTGVAAPGAGSNGLKLHLYGATPGTMAAIDYGIGIEGSNLWMNTGGGIKLYSGSALRAEMASTGTISATAFHASNGDSAAAPGHTWIGDTNTGIFHPIADVIGISINGTERARVLGIGVSTTGAFYAGNGSVSSPAFNFHADLNTGMYRAGTDIIGFSTNGAERARIIAGGISTTGVYYAGNGSTATPSFNFSSDLNTGMYRAYTDTVGFSVNGTDRMRVGGTGISTTGVIYTGNGSAAAPAHTFSGDTNNGMFLATTDAIGFTTAGTESMRILANGNVGIGLTAPAVKLQIVGGTDATASNGSGYIVVGSESGLNIVVDNNELIARNNGVPSNFYMTASDFGLTGTSTDYVFNLINNNTATGTDGMAIQTGPISNPTTASYFVRFRDGDGTDIGSISGNGSGGVAFNTTSDRRIKDHIVATRYSLNHLMQVKVRDYNPKDEPTKVVTGFVAQELYEVFPDAVVKPDDEGQDFWGVDYGRVTPLIVKAVQDLKAENDNLRAKNQDYEARLRALEQKAMSH